MTNIDALLQPGKIGTMTLRNRLVMASMGGFSGAGDTLQKSVDFYSERAKGGASLITMPTVVYTRANMPTSTGAFDPKSTSRLTEIAKSVQKHGARMATQLGYITLINWQGVQQVGPSAVPSFTHKLNPRALSSEEIQEVVVAMGEAAQWVKGCGMDALEIQAAHGFFLAAFQSPFLNRRADKYGGSLENRARFTAEVISRVRAEVGKDFPILIRMNCRDFVQGGLEVEEAAIMASLFEAAGVDAIDVSAAIQDSRQWRDLSYMYPDGALVDLAHSIKKRVKIPVIVVGKIGNLALANSIIADGKADFVAMARGVLAEPELLNKTRQGRTSEIHGCIYCNNCRIDRTAPDGTRKRGIACTVNPALGRETDFVIKPATDRKKVMVVGGGLAGMQAAAVLAQRGHHVTLHEKSGQLGGQWNIACKLPHKSGFQSVIAYLFHSLNTSGVEVKLNSEVSVNRVKELKPDAVVVATGALPISPEVPGITGNNVVQAVSLIDGQANAGKRVVVIGGRFRGMEVAELLADQGKKVTLVTRGRLGGSGELLERNLFVTLRDRLIEEGVAIIPFTPVFEIRQGGVYVVLDNELLFLPADTVVLAAGSRPENALANNLKGLVPEVYSIGDCARVRDAREAINEGAEIGRRI
jgi:2,4-dienoyl-CoA reductase-like NADH-dependent reductase (Old Yellow Enzyme family)/thioredoxin reductase